MNVTCHLCGQYVGKLLSLHLFTCPELDKVVEEETTARTLIEQAEKATPDTSVLKSIEHDPSEPVVRLPKPPRYRKRMIEVATELEWLRWLRVNHPPHERVLEVLKASFEKETKKTCPENL